MTELSSLPTSSTSHTHEAESGSFVTGFTIGLFAGAIGYYLFGTRDGRSLVKDVQHEWQEAQSHLKTQLAQASDSQVGQQVATTAKGWWSSLKEELHRAAQAEAPKAQPRKKTPAPKVKTKSKHTFTGV